MKRVNIQNERFGMLTAIEPTDQRNFGNVIWKCRCDCGQITYRSTNYLDKDRMCSCGCYAEIQHQKQRRDIKDQRFGSLVAMEPTGKSNKTKQRIWRFRCDCGTVIERPISEVTKKTNPTHSCGCSRAWFIGNSGHGKKYYSNLQKNRVMGTDIMEIRRKDETPTRANTSGYQGVSYITTRDVWVAYCRFQGYYAQKTCHSLEDAIRARQQMRQIRDDFIEWYDSLTEEERQEAIEKYDSNRNFFKNYYRDRMQEIMRQ